MPTETLADEKEIGIGHTVCAVRSGDIGKSRLFRFSLTINVLGELNRDAPLILFEPDQGRA